MKRFENYNYCHTCGYDVEYEHTSATCNTPGHNHNHNNTRKNKMGVTKKGYHNTKMPSQAGRQPICNPQLSASASYYKKHQKNQRYGGNGAQYQKLMQQPIVQHPMAQPMIPQATPQPMMQQPMMKQPMIQQPMMHQPMMQPTWKNGTGGGYMWRGGAENNCTDKINFDVNSYNKPLILTHNKIRTDDHSEFGYASATIFPKVTLSKKTEWNGQF